MIKKPSLELQKALENLMDFVSNKGKVSLTSSCLQAQAGEVKIISQTSFKNFLSLLRRLGRRFFSLPAITDDPEIYAAINHSCEVIRKYAIYIQLWEKGSAEQRLFACEARLTIQHFNRLVEKLSSMAPLLTKIEFTPVTSLNIRIVPPTSSQYDPTKMLSKIAEKAPHALAKKVTKLRESFLPVQAQELFMMKAISLLEKNELASHAQARQMLKGQPIHTYCDDVGIHHLAVTFLNHEEQSIEVQGAFMGRIPLPDRFQLTVSVSGLDAEIKY